MLAAAGNVHPLTPCSPIHPSQYLLYLAPASASSRPSSTRTRYWQRSRRLVARWRCACSNENLPLPSTSFGTRLVLRCSPSCPCAWVTGVARCHLTPLLRRAQGLQRFRDVLETPSPSQANPRKCMFLCVFVLLRCISSPDVRGGQVAARDHPSPSIRHLVGSLLVRAFGTRRKSPSLLTATMRGALSSLCGVAFSKFCARLADLGTSLPPCFTNIVTSWADWRM